MKKEGAQSNALAACEQGPLLWYPGYALVCLQHVNFLCLFIEKTFELNLNRIYQFLRNKVDLKG